MTEMVSPLVSVCMITYNHEKYIAQAIESVLVQQTDFQYELVIGEDCSLDGTRAVVRVYGESYPDQIRLLLPEHNIGAMANFAATLKACRGQYIALLEGDDYWTDPAKLQKQVSFLKEHPDYAICFHNTLIKYENSDDLPHLREKKIWDTYSVKEVIRANSPPGHTSSAVFRNSALDDFPTWFFDSVSGDIPLFILVCSHGLAKYCNETMSVHRIHSGGISRQHLGINIDILWNRIRLYDSINRHFDLKYDYLIRPIASRYYVQIALIYKQQHNTKSFVGIMAKSMRRDLRTLIYLLENYESYRLIRNCVGKVKSTLKYHGIKYIRFVKNALNTR